MAPSSDVKDTEEDKEEDESNNSIARSFEKPSANVKEASYFNIFVCRRNILDKLDVTYQRAFTASEKMPMEVRITTRNPIKQEKPSPVASPVTSSY